jgi:hypothetical protein
MQKLNVELGNGTVKEMYFDRSWRDNGADPQYAYQGGQKILIAQGTRPFPEVFQNGDQFFYKDGSPLTDPAHVGPHIPEKYRKLAYAFIEKMNGEKAPKKVTAEIPSVAKGRGRPKKVDAKDVVIEIKDAESFTKAGGVII